MADAEARKAAIKKASSQVQSGGAFVRRAPGATNATKVPKTVQVPHQKQN